VAGGAVLLVKSGCIEPVVGLAGDGQQDGTERERNFFHGISFSS
jgi:hypothetical protein